MAAGRGICDQRLDERARSRWAGEQAQNPSRPSLAGRGGARVRAPPAGKQDAANTHASRSASAARPAAMAVEPFRCRRSAAQREARSAGEKPTPCEYGQTAEICDARRRWHPLSSRRALPRRTFLKAARVHGRPVLSPPHVDQPQDYGCSSRRARAWGEVVDQRCPLASQVSQRLRLLWRTSPVRSLRTPPAAFIRPAQPMIVGCPPAFPDRLRRRLVVAFRLARLGPRQSVRIRPWSPNVSKGGLDVQGS
jgi:hypothetical protein